MGWLTTVRDWIWGHKGQLAPIELEVERVAKGTRKEMTRRESRLQAEAIRGTQIDLLSRELWPALIGAEATQLSPDNPFYTCFPHHKGDTVFRIEIDTEHNNDFGYLRREDLMTVGERMNENGDWKEIYITADWYPDQLTLKPGQTLYVYLIQPTVQ